MHDARTLLLKGAGGLLLVLTIFYLRALTPYIPSSTLVQVASSASDPDMARGGLFEALSRCFRSGHLEAADVGRRLSVLHSLENDAGFLATTRIACNDSRCEVSASALIPMKARVGECRGARRGGRQGGFSDYFDRK